MHLQEFVYQPGLHQPMHAHDYASLSQIDRFVKRTAEKASDGNRALASYAGTYVSDAYGTMVIRLDNGTLHATIGDRSSVLHPIRGDTYYARWFASGGPSPVVFGTDSLAWEGRAFARK